jgi:type II secretory pathway pseudopilin PulG
MKSQISNLKSQKHGFTLLETLAAISVLTFAVIGPLTLAYYSIRSSSVSQNQLTAFYLAQEAIEYIKNLRDNNALQRKGNWLDGLAPSGGGNGLCRNDKGCTVDIPYNIINQCPGSGDCLKMRYSSDTGFYHQNTSFGIESPFTRKIKLDFVNSYEEKVSVTISWQEKFGFKSFKLEENIFNWP